MVDIDHARVGAQPGHQPVNAFTAAGYRTVDAFFGDQQRTFDAVINHRLEQGLAQFNVIFKRDEFIQCSNNDRCSHGYVSRWLPS